MGPDFSVFTCNQCLCPCYRFEPTLTQTTQLIKTPNAKLPSGTERNCKRMRDTVREIKRMMMMTSCLNDSFNPFPLICTLFTSFGSVFGVFVQVGCLFGIDWSGCGKEMLL